jgi:uncharacterized protein YjiS (DUF1127 family)
MHDARDFRLSRAPRPPETAGAGTHAATRPAKEMPMSTACLDPRADRAAAPAAPARRERPRVAAPRPVAKRPAARGDAAESDAAEVDAAEVRFGWRRLAVRAQWGPLPADAVRLEARGVRVVPDGHRDASDGSLAAWAAASSDAARAGRSPRRAVAALARAAVSIASLAAAAIASVAAASLDAWRRERRIAAGVTALHELDARMLRDLGIERADIERVARDGGRFPRSRARLGRGPRRL